MTTRRRSIRRGLAGTLLLGIVVQAAVLPPSLVAREVAT